MSFLEQSHPEYAADQRDAAQAVTNQLHGVCLEIESYRQILRPVPSENAWVRTWPGLGSQKTYSKILRQDFDGINSSAKLPDYRGVLAAVTAHQRSKGAEELYEDIGGAQAVQLAFLRLMHHHGKDRLISIEGASGSGKTCSLDVLQAAGSYGSSIYRLDANETWRSLRVTMRAMLRALKVSEEKIPSSGGEMMELLKSTIAAKGRIAFAIDECHHISGAVINLFKTLLNETEMLLILAGVGTLLRKLRAAAAEEAKQLFDNRLFCRVTLGGPNESGARDFLSRRLGIQGRDWKPSTLQTLCNLASHTGHWAFLRRTVDQLQSSGTNDPSDSDLLGAGQLAAKEIA